MGNQSGHHNNMMMMNQHVNNSYHQNLIQQQQHQHQHHQMQNQFQAGKFPLQQQQTHSALTNNLSELVTLTGSNDLTAALMNPLSANMNALALNGGGGGVDTNSNSSQSPPLGTLNPAGAIGSGMPGGFSGNGNLNPPVRQNGKMCNMQIRTKFGTLGAAKAQFNSPHGFCLGIDEEIIVADTNNHRIQVFDKEGNFRYAFGSPGREEGQLWYPRKVAVIRDSGKFVVCDRGSERSRMQIFNKSGHFLKVSVFSISFDERSSNMNVPSKAK
jgi:tripartite motif-containing protein 2/3